MDLILVLTFPDIVALGAFSIARLPWLHPRHALDAALLSPPGLTELVNNERKASVLPVCHDLEINNLSVIFPWLQLMHQDISRLSQSFSCGHGHCESCASSVRGMRVTRLLMESWNLVCQVVSILVLEALDHCIVTWSWHGSLLVNSQ